MDGQIKKGAITFSHRSGIFYFVMISNKMGGLKFIVHLINQECQFDFLLADQCREFEFSDSL